MHPVLEDAETRQMVFPISREVYQTFGRLGSLQEDVELIEGVILRKMPKSPYHILLVRRLLALLEAAVAENLAAGGPQRFVAKEDPIGTPDSEPEPELAIIRGEPGDYGHDLPTTALLVIEVSVSSSARDQCKAALYAQVEVPEYWIVDGDRHRIERFSAPLPETREYQNHEILAGDRVVQSIQLTEFSVPLTELFRIP